jgi:hypothetical protein
MTTKAQKAAVELQEELQEQMPESPPKYTINELMAAAGATFNTQPEVVYTALQCKGITEATREEAQAAINEFMKKEV